MTRPAKDRRDEIVRVAVELLEEHGAAEMSVRKITTQIGTSRIAIYTAFESMGGLVAAVVDHGFTLLRDEYRKLDDQEVGISRIWSTLTTTRNFALAHRHLYAVMFAAETFGGYQRSGPELELGNETLRHLHSACESAYSRQQLTRGDNTWFATRQLWVTTHGHLMLELVGYLNRDGQPERSFAATIATALIGLGASADAVQAVTGQK